VAKAHTDSTKKYIREIRVIRGFLNQPQISTNFHELFWGKMACFSIILHTFAYIYTFKKAFVS